MSWKVNDSLKMSKIIGKRKIIGIKSTSDIHQNFVSSKNLVQIKTSIICVNYLMNRNFYFSTGFTLLSEFLPRSRLGGHYFPAVWALKLEDFLKVKMRNFYSLKKWNLFKILKF